MEVLYIEEIRYGVLGAILVAQSVSDIRSKRLPFWITGMGMVVGIALWLLAGNVHLTDLVALIPGLICLGISKISKEAIGYGDGLLLIMMGWYLALGQLLEVCMWAFTLAGIFGLFLLVTKKKKGKQEIPFVPFLLIGYVLGVVL